MPNAHSTLKLLLFKKKFAVINQSPFFPPEINNMSKPRQKINKIK